MQIPQLDPVQVAINSLAKHLSTVPDEHIAIDECLGRVLAEPLCADRDSPALDVSAMDGYAVRLEDLGSDSMVIQATAPAGQPPVALNAGEAIRIFTGAPIPWNANCVVRREDAIESADRVSFSVPTSTLSYGQNIRPRGENTRGGAVVIPAGNPISAANIAAVAGFGLPKFKMRRKVRVTILNTGDELAQPGQRVEEWQIRDSNGPTLEAWLKSLPWAEMCMRQCVEDTFGAVCTALSQQADCDAVILTGGVSMGDADFVPSAIEHIGGQVAFHRLPIRPGKPVLGASLNGKLLLGLPGNPVSVAVTSRVFGEPLLRKLAGIAQPKPRPLVALSNPDDKQVDLIWFRPVGINGRGEVELVASQGSGDFVSLSHSCGFVEIPPRRSGAGPFRLTMW